MSLRRKENGFSAVELLIIIVIAGVVAFAGYTVSQRSSDTNETANTSEITQGEVPIENAQDLENAEAELDDLNIEELDTSELDAIEAELL